MAVATETGDEGCLHHRALPTLDPIAVDALAKAVKPLLDEDDTLAQWCTNANVERFLRADRGHLGKATKRLTETLRWRQQVRPESQMCTACFGKDLRSHYMQHVGWDKRGRALVYSDIGMAVDKNASSNAEHCMQVLELLEPQLNKFPNDQYVWVVDFHKFGVADMSPKVAGACLGLFGKSYPERLGGMIIVGAPMLFNGLYRAVCTFADPVTVKKVRFCQSPDGKGGGKNWDTVMDEFFSLETKYWLATEMRENRAEWKTVGKQKSWLASVVTGCGNTHGWQAAYEREREEKGESKSKKSSSKTKELDTSSEFPPKSLPGHDIRGCVSFLSSNASVAARERALRHASKGEATRGVVLAAAMKNLPPGFALENLETHEAEDAFYDARDCL